MDALPGRRRHRGSLGRAGAGFTAPVQSGPAAGGESRVAPPSFPPQAGLAHEAPVPNAAADLVSRPSIPGLRREAPGRREYHRGRVPQLSSPASQSDALLDFDQDVFAATSRESEASKRRTLDLLMEAWQQPLLPLSSKKIRLLGASLKAGGYRSAAQYLATAKRLHETADGEVTPALRLALRDARRSCEGGLGPARRLRGQHTA